MDLAGGKYTYVSRKKVENVRSKLEKSKGLNTLDKIQEIQESEICDIKEESKQFEKNQSNFSIRSRRRSRSKSRSRSRSNSRESVKSVDLDMNYSCEEDNIVEDDDVIFEEAFKPQPLLSGHKPEKKKKTFKPVPKKKAQYSLQSIDHQSNTYKHEVDTNILSLKLNFLKEKLAYATGDPYSCSQCRAIFNKFSKIEVVTVDGKDEQIWQCEFCKKENTILIENEEIPKADCVDYFVENISKVQNLKYNDEKTIIYCFDISGSMCVSEPLSGKHKIKGDFLNKYKNDLMKFSDGSNQFYDGNSGNTTYVSRLQCLQAGIESYVQQMAKSAPKNKVGFVTFSNEVICYGDGTSKDIVRVNGNNLMNYDVIVDTAEKAQQIISKPISETHQELIKTLYTIEESGQTALGPGILFAVNMIKNATAGSKILLCTDGLANIGLGSMEDLNKTNDENLEKEIFIKLTQFYTDIAEFAKSNGIIINILTFEGEESKIAILSVLCDLTGGEIIRVKPSQILSEFANLLESDIVATGVKITVQLQNLLEFRNENEKDLSQNKSVLVREVGNATDQTEFYVEYCVKSSDDLVKMNIDLDKIQEVYFQSVINYIDLEGNKCKRVITKSQLLSFSKEEVSKQAQYDIISCNAMQQCSKLAKEGDYRKAQSNAKAWKQMMKKNFSNNIQAQQNYDNFNIHMNDINNNLQKVQYEEKCQGMNLEDDKIKERRKINCVDHVSSSISQLQRINRNKISKVVKKN